MSIEDTGDVWYRFEDWITPGGGIDIHGEWEFSGVSHPHVALRVLPVVKYTPCGVRLRIPCIWGNSTRLVLHKARKAYAAPTRVKAFNDWLCRKNKALRIHQARANEVERIIATGCLKYREDYLETDEYKKACKLPRKPPRP